MKQNRRFGNKLKAYDNLDFGIGKILKLVEIDNIVH